MLESWGGDGLDTITEEEYQRVGHEKAVEYHETYCWHYGMGYCDNCALIKHRRKVDANDNREM